MHVLRTTLLSGLILCTAWTPAAADERVTALLRNGERVTGRYDGSPQGLLYIDVSDTDERKIPIGEVALIDLVGGAQGLPETELSQARGSQHLLLLRNGTALKGQLVRIEDSKDSRSATVVFRTESGEERRTPLSDVGRLYLGNFPGQAPPSSGGSTTAPTPTPDPPPGGVVRVPANQKWVDTGITVRQGQQVGIASSGEVKLTADGSETSGTAGVASGRRAANATAPDLPVGALIARIGNGPPFAIGNLTNVVMPSAGRLYLGVNDDVYDDNQGHYDVRLTPGATPRGR